MDFYFALFAQDAYNTKRALHVRDTQHPHGDASRYCIEMSNIIPEGAGNVSLRRSRRETFIKIPTCDVRYTLSAVSRERHTL